MKLFKSKTLIYAIFVTCLLFSHFVSARTNDDPNFLIGPCTIEGPNNIEFVGVVYIPAYDSNGNLYSLPVNEYHEMNPCGDIVNILRF